MSEEMRVVSCGCSVVLKLIAGCEPAADNTRLVRLGFDNWLSGVALFGVTSALVAACGSSNDTYMVVTGGAGGDLLGSGGDSSKGSGGDSVGSGGGSSGSASGGRGGQQSSGGEGGLARGGTSQAGGFGGVSGSIDIGGLGGDSGSGNVGGMAGFSGSGGVSGAAGFGGAAGFSGAAGFAGASGGGGSSGSGGVSGASGSAGASGSGGSGGSGTVENLIVNGDFSQGEVHWEFYPPGGAYTHAVISGRLCVTLDSYEYVIVGWPLEVGLAPALTPGGSYTLSYTAYSTQPGEVSLLTKVGHAESPYTPVIEQARTLTGSPQLFSHSFSTVGDSGAGIAFNLQATFYASNNNICFDDVSLTAN
jgi:hypothetical protein